MKNKSIRDQRERQPRERDGYFISANGYSGFRSRHAALYASEAYERVFVIMGGPGTGKSRLMTELGHCAQEAGAVCEYVFCSSDPASLDGVIIEKGAHRIALLDGTAPHVRVAEHPGSIDEIVNLGDCWDAARLSSARERILSLERGKGACYRRAYRALARAGLADGHLQEVLAPCVLEDKLKGAIRRELRLLRISHTPGERVRYLSACSMDGMLRFESFREERTLISVSDEYGAARLFLNGMRDVLREEGVYRYDLYPSCYADEITEGIGLPENKVLYLTEADVPSGRRINMRRFLSATRLQEERKELRRLSALVREMKLAASEALCEAGRYHFALEELYGGAMDFSAKEAKTQALGKRILSLLEATPED